MQVLLLEDELMLQSAIAEYLTDIGYEVDVFDNGRGIDKNEQELVFEKFYRVSKGNIHDVKGFGIGLYYCNKIIEKHGGVLSLNSKTGSTTFKISMDVES